MYMVLLGPPGAGKGTQAKLMEERLRVRHVSTGDLLRSAIREGTALGMTAKRFMDRGELVPDELVIDMISARLHDEDCRAGAMLDGFPRTVPQARALEELLGNEGLRLDHVVSLTVPEEELLRRATGRRTCSECGAMCHLVFNPPMRQGLCNRCGGVLFQREDDREQTVRARLEVYEKRTAPLREYYRDRHLLREVDGIGPTDEVLRRILVQLDVCR